MRRTPLVETLESRTLFSSYVIAPIGSDSAAGTSAAPWKTIQRAVSAVKAGDVVNVRAGTYAGFMLGWDGQMAGTATSPITFKADPGVIINATNSHTRDGISVENCNYIVIDGFNIQPTATDAAWRSGIRLGGGGNGNIVRNNTVTMRSQDTQGIFSSFSQNQVVEYNEVSGNQDAGIYCSNSAINPTVRGNYVHDLSSITGQGVGLHFNGDVSQGGTGIIQGGLIEQNRVVNCGNAINMDGMQNATIRNNVLTNNTGKGIAIYNRDASGPSSGNSVINNTVVQPTGIAAIFVLGAATNTTIANNILSTQSGPDIYFDSAALSGTKSDNNVLITSSGRPFQGGVGGDTSMTMATWRSTYSFDTHSITSNSAAVFSNPSSGDYTLRQSSPARRMADMTKIAAADFFNLPRFETTGGDVGAYRYIVPGDTNFDGRVTPQDYTAVDSTLGQVRIGHEYLAGDTNFDGRVTAQDYTAVDSNLGIIAL
jgi:parallel beta-helix repeat protein